MSAENNNESQNQSQRESSKKLHDEGILRKLKENVWILFYALIPVSLFLLYISLNKIQSALIKKESSSSLIFSVLWSDEKNVPKLSIEIFDINLFIKEIDAFTVTLIIDSISWIFACLLVTLIIMLVQYVSFKIAEYRYRNEKSGVGRIVLYNWLGNSDLDPRYFYNWLEDKARNNIHQNLMTIKEKIKKSVQNNKENSSQLIDYYLIKSYLEYHAKTNFLYKTWNIIKTFLITFISSGLATAIGYSGFINFFSESDKGLWNYINLSTAVISLLYILTAVVVFIRSELTRNRRIIDLLIMVVDNIIQEEECKKKEKINVP